MAGSGKATIDRVIGITQREEGHGAGRRKAAHDGGQVSLRLHKANAGDRPTPARSLRRKARRRRC